MGILKSLFSLDTYRGWLEAAKEKFPSFLQPYLDYGIKNPILLLALVGLLLCIFITIVVLICVAARVSKKKKRQKAAAQQTIVEVQAPEETEEITQTQEQTENIETVEAVEETPVVEEPAKAPIAEVAAAPVEEKEPEAVEEVEEVEEVKEPTETVEQPTPAPIPAPMAETPAPMEQTKAEAETEKNPRYKGKWVMQHLFTDAPGENEETFFFELHASNGEKLLTSEEYTSYNGALRGIETYKNNIARGNFKITLSKKGHYIFKLLSGKNTLLCTGENYTNRMSCESAIESTKRFAETATLDKRLHERLIKAPLEDEGAIAPLPDGYNGKWVIESTKDADGETLYYFVLYANNGEKLLTSEDYTTYVGAVNGIATHKKNIEAGNFRITLTKRGDYIYKLLNGNGQLLCLGEHYKTKRLCQSAVDSVKRFALNSPILVNSNIKK